MLIRKVAIVVFLLFILGCSEREQIVLQQTWFPVQVEDFKGQIDDSQLMLYALTFTDSSRLLSRTLGTSYSKVSNYKLIDNKLELSDKDRSDTIDVISIGQDQLKLQYDSFNIVTYIPFSDVKYEDHTTLLNNKLSNHSWYLEEANSSINGELLVEFKDSLEDRIVKHYLRDKLNAAGIHAFENDYSDFHMRAAWGVNYFKKTNLLSIAELGGSSLNKVIVVTSVSDSLISGFRFVENGKLPVQLIRAKANIENINRLISKEWVLKEFEQIEEEYGVFWNSFGGIEKAIKLSDFKEKRITFKFQSDSLFLIKVNSDTLTHGTWRLSQSGRLIELISRYQENGHQLTRNYFLSIIQLDNTLLQIYRRENIQSGENEFARLKFFETFRPM